MTTLVAASDLHGHLPEVPECDVLLLAGDLMGPENERDPDAYRAWLSEDFAAWLEGVPAGEVYGIAGNHDGWAAAELGPGVHQRPFGGRWTYLQDATITSASGLRIHGSPWIPISWENPFEAGPEALEAAFALIPEGLDVLMIHVAPDGHGDTLKDDGLWLGCREIVPAIERAQPRLVVYGHCHDGGGYRGEIGASRLANVALANRQNQPVRRPSVFTLSD